MLQCNLEEREMEHEGEAFRSDSNITYHLLIPIDIKTIHRLESSRTKINFLQLIAAIKYEIF